MPSGLLVLDTIENGGATWHMHKILYTEWLHGHLNLNPRMFHEVNTAFLLNEKLL